MTAVIAFSRTARRRAAFVAALLSALVPAAPLSASEAATALTPTRVVYPGETVSADAVGKMRLRAVSAAPVATDLSQVDGKVAKRTLVPGRPIALAALREAWLVEQGKSVEAVYSLNNLSISLTALALESGAVGDLVRLRNPDSGKTFSGTVLPNGTVAVGGS